MIPTHKNFIKDPTYRDPFAPAKLSVVDNLVRGSIPLPYLRNAIFPPDEEAAKFSINSSKDPIM